MKKKVLLLLLIFTSCLTGGLFSGCGSKTPKYVLSYTLYYYEEVDGKQERVEDVQYLKTNESTGNVLDDYDHKMVAPDGYTFGGYETEEGLKVFDADMKQVKNVKLTTDMYYINPIWIPKTYTFLFVESEAGGRISINEEKTFTLEIGKEFSPATFHTVSPVEYNTEFIGWSANSDEPDKILTNKSGAIYQQYTLFGINSTYKHVSSYVDENGNTQNGDFILLRPKFDYIKHEVSINYNDWGVQNSVQNTSIKVINEQSMPNLDEYNKTINGKTIYGFSTSKTEYVPFSGYVTEPVTLYAIWEQYKDVRLHYYSDIAETIKYYEITPSVLPSPDFEREHYTFVGWFDNPSFGGPVISRPAFSEIKEDYYAKWNPVSYKITFHVNGGESIVDGTYVYGLGKTLPVPNKNYSKFLGWCTDELLQTTPIFELSITTGGNLNLYALWEDSIPISTKEGLAAISSNPSKGYYLTKDICLDGENWTPISSFSGIFDGCGFKVFDFSLTHTSGSSASYAFIKENYGIIKNLKLDAFDINYTSKIQNAGVLIAKNYGIIENCHLSNASSTSSSCSIQFRIDNGSDTISIGLIAAYNAENATIMQCSAHTLTNVSSIVNHAWDNGRHNIEVKYYISPICGQNIGTIDSCYSGNQVNITGWFYNSNEGYNVIPSNVVGLNSFSVGGVVGKNEQNAIVTKSHSSVSLSNNVTYSGTNYGTLQSSFGGIVGFNVGSIQSSYAENVNISGDFINKTTDSVGIGGVVGVNTSTGSISNSYSKNFISSARNIATGGFVGNNYGTIQKSYVADANLVVETVSSDWYIGGFVGYNHISGVVRYCIADSTISLPNADSNVLARQFAGDKEFGSTFRDCFYTDASKILIGEVEQTEKKDSNAEETAYSNLINKQFLTDMLWSEEYWNIDGINLPTIKN